MTVYAVREKRDAGLRLYGYTTSLTDGQTIARALNRYWSFEPNAFKVYPTSYAVPAVWNRNLRQVIVRGGVKPRVMGYFLENFAIAVSGSLNSELRDPLTAITENELGMRIAGIERQNPLPPGRYWQDIFEPQETTFNEWLAPKLDKSVKVLVSEGFPGERIARNWVLFEVLEPVEWPQKELGFPTKAGAEVTTSSDTVQVEPTKTTTEIVEELGHDFKEGISNMAKPIAWGVGIGLGLVVLSHLGKRS